MQVGPESIRLSSVLANTLQFVTVRLTMYLICGFE
jgi:hypothetical protein